VKEDAKPLPLRLLSKKLKESGCTDDTVNSKWGRDVTDPAVVLAMPPLRQTLFRGVWAEGSNKYFDADNKASIRSDPDLADEPAPPKDPDAASKNRAKLSEAMAKL